MESSLPLPLSCFVLQQIIVKNDDGGCLYLLKEGKYQTLKWLCDSSESDF